MHPFTATLPHDPIHLRGLRRSLTTWFEAEGVPEQCRAPLMLATHEAAANAIKHGEVDRPVRVTVTYGAESLSVVVRNDPRWGESDLTPGPRGLAMMRELMSEVRPTTTVRMRSDLSAEAVANEWGELVLRHLELTLLPIRSVPVCKSFAVGKARADYYFVSVSSAGGGRNWDLRRQPPEGSGGC